MHTRNSNFRNLFAILFFQILFRATLLSAAESSLQFIKGSDTLIVYKDVPGLAPSEFYKIRVRSAATNNQWVECFANIIRSLWSTIPEGAKGSNNSR